MPPCPESCSNSAGAYGRGEGLSPRSFVTGPHDASDKDPRFDVLIVAGQSDQRAEAVEGELAKLGASSMRLDISALARCPVSSHVAGPLLVLGESPSQIGRESSVWWRRPGSLDTPAMDFDEALVAQCGQGPACRANH